jgi:hypothetical protein
MTVLVHICREKISEERIPLQDTRSSCKMEDDDALPADPREATARRSLSGTFLPA